MNLKLKAIGSNMNELTVGNNVILFSYNTPVAAHVQGEGYYRTEEHYSVTTSRHINKWLDGMIATNKPQSFFDSLVKS